MPSSVDDFLLTSTDLLLTSYLKGKILENT